ncbi:MAG: transposase [Xenococcaceae cyanobacterium]
MPTRSLFQHQRNTYNKNDVGIGQILTPFQRKLLQKSLQDDLPEQYRQRIEIMLLADEGKTQTQICQALGCSQATARHWIFMAHSGQAHKWQEQPIGRPKSVNEEYLERLQELVSQSPRAFDYSFQRWTAHWLSKHLAQEFGIEVTARHINRLLKQMGLSTRGKPSKTEENRSENSRGDAADTLSARILIRDLQSPKVPDS